MLDCHVTVRCVVFNCYVSAGFVVLCFDCHVTARWVVFNCYVSARCVVFDRPLVHAVVLFDCSFVVLIVPLVRAVLCSIVP